MTNKEWLLSAPVTTFCDNMRREREEWKNVEQYLKQHQKNHKGTITMQSLKDEYYYACEALQHLKDCVSQEGYVP